MHIQTHILSGWCVANVLPFSARQRMACMIAATAADLDGIGIVVSQDFYWNYHHKLCHNLCFGILISLILAILCRQRFKTFLACLGLFHLHLWMDYWGSGPGWHIHYLWPVASLVLKNPNAWEFYSWQNLTIFLGLFLITLWIARRMGRTPIELIAPRLDRDIARWLGYRGKLPKPDPHAI